ncbi:CIC11C00000003049 [Sungouiella intermedia]|uniref:CIC11C00000003049 n=1 Tax=Sungouiella intermedia TaxID=45354 RepID=A0A1L0BZ84_9ASCO|nr:CIC11C00000003049 [[Candida] intermedia]
MKDIVLEIFAQQPLEIYTQICFCYAFGDNSRDLVVEILQNGLQSLTTSFPWVSGQVIRDTESGLYKITSLGDTPRLIVKDLTESLSMDKLRNAGFPCSMLDEQTIAPRSTLPGVFSDSEESPCFLIQASFIKKGLILTFLAHHQVFDGTGEGQIISLLSKACKGEPFTAEELATGNMNRENIVKLFTEEEKKEYGELKIGLEKQIIPENPLTFEPSESFWATFTFSADSLKELKALASKNLRSVPFVSTDDTLTAFIWQALSRARSSRLPENSKTSIARAINVRPYLGIPSTYPGVINNMTYNDYELRDIVQLPLGEVASSLRSKIDKRTSQLAKDSRALATLIDATKDSPITSATASIYVPSDIALSSWAQQNSYSLDFGLSLGKPESVRRPQFTPVESLAYILPKSLEGDISVAICLREEDMEKLRSEIGNYAQYVR